MYPYIHDEDGNVMLDPPVERRESWLWSGFAAFAMLVSAGLMFWLAWKLLDWLL